MEAHLLRPSSFLEQTTDRKIDLLFWVLRYPTQRMGLELFTEPSQNKIYYRLYPNYTSFSCFLIICSSEIWKFLFYEIGVTYSIFDILREVDWMLLQTSADNFGYGLIIFLYISWKYKYWCIQKGLCDAVQP